jgi:hypothetical protein
MRDNIRQKVRSDPKRKRPHRRVGNLLADQCSDKRVSRDKHAANIIPHLSLPVTIKNKGNEKQRLLQRRFSW